jgi:hypothetical protein
MHQQQLMMSEASGAVATRLWRCLQQHVYFLQQLLQLLLPLLVLPSKSSHKAPPHMQIQPPAQPNRHHSSEAQPPHRSQNPKDLPKDPGRQCSIYHSIH